MLGSIALIFYLIMDSVQAICTTGQYWNPLNNACVNCIIFNDKKNVLGVLLIFITLIHHQMDVY